MISITRIALFLILSFVLLQSGAQAEDSSNGGFRFRGKPLPECTFFPIIESGGYFKIAGTGMSEMITGDVGLMFNINKNSAIGGTFGFFSDDYGLTFGVGPRYRKWLDRYTAIDISPRIFLFRTGDRKLKFPVLALSGSIAFYELFSIDLYYKFVRYELRAGRTFFYPVRGTESSLHIGITGRSYLAPVMPLVLLLGYLIVIGGSGY